MAGFKMSSFDALKCWYQVFNQERLLDTFCGLHFDLDAFILATEQEKEKE